jgi:hypothetical protein
MKLASVETQGGSFSLSVISNKDQALLDGQRTWEIGKEIG